MHNNPVPVPPLDLFLQTIQFCTISAIAQNISDHACDVLGDDKCRKRYFGRLQFWSKSKSHAEETDSSPDFHSP